MSEGHSIEEIVNRYVDLLLEVDKVLTMSADIPLVPFFRLVAEEMRRRGISEDKISMTLKGASWGERQTGKIVRGIAESPSVLVPKEEEIKEEQELADIGLGDYLESIERDEEEERR